MAPREVTTLGRPPMPGGSPETRNPPTTKEKKKRNERRRKKQPKRPPSHSKLIVYATNALKDPIPGSLRRRRKVWTTLSAPISALVWRVLHKGAPLLFERRRPPPRTIKARPLNNETLKVVQDFIKDGLDCGEIEECKRRPQVLSPLFVIPKK